MRDRIDNVFYEILALVLLPPIVLAAMTVLVVFWISGKLKSIKRVLTK